MAGRGRSVHRHQPPQLLEPVLDEDLLQARRFAPMANWLAIWLNTHRRPVRKGDLQQSSRANAIRRAHQLAPEGGATPPFLEPLLHSQAPEEAIGVAAHSRHDGAGRLPGPDVLTEQGTLVVPRIVQLGLPV